MKARSANRNRRPRSESESGLGTRGNKSIWYQPFRTDDATV